MYINPENKLLNHYSSHDSECRIISGSAQFKDSQILKLNCIVWLLRA